MLENFLCCLNIVSRLLEIIKWKLKQLALSSDRAIEFWIVLMLFYYNATIISKLYI